MQILSRWQSSGASSVTAEHTPSESVQTGLPRPAGQAVLPQEETVGCLCMHAQEGGNCMLSAAEGKGGSPSSPLHISFSKHLVFTAMEGMGCGCQLGHHWRVSDGGESEDVLKQRSSQRCLVEGMQLPCLGHQGHWRKHMLAVGSGRRKLTVASERKGLTFDSPVFKSPLENSSLYNTCWNQ